MGLRPVAVSLRRTRSLHRRCGKFRGDAGGVAERGPGGPRRPAPRAGRAAEPAFQPVSPLPSSPSNSVSAPVGTDRAALSVSIRAGGVRGRRGPSSRTPRAVLSVPFRAGYRGGVSRRHATAAPFRSGRESRGGGGPLGAGASLRSPLPSPARRTATGIASLSPRPLARRRASDLSRPADPARLSRFGRYRARRRCVSAPRRAIPVGSRPSGGRGPGRGGPGPPCAFEMPMITAFCNSH